MCTACCPIAAGAIDFGCARGVRLAQASSDSAALALALNGHRARQGIPRPTMRTRALSWNERWRWRSTGAVRDLAAGVYISLQTAAIIHHDHAFALGVGFARARVLRGA